MFEIMNANLPSSSSFFSFSDSSLANSSSLFIEGNNDTQQQWTQQSNQTGRLIVETLDGLELHEIIGDEHASAVHRLIVASTVIAMISAILIATVVLFRCYMLYCQDYLNIRRYQRPPLAEECQNAAEMTILSQQQPSRQNTQNFKQSGFERKSQIVNGRNLRMIFDDSMSY